MQKARRHHINVLRPLVGTRFQGLFHSSVRSSFHLSLTVLVRYRVSREYLALPDGPGGFTQDSSCPALLRIPLRFASLRVRSSHALWPDFPVRSARDGSCDGVVLQPRACRDTRGLGSSPVRSPLLGESLLFSFPAGTKMFQFPALASGIAG